MTRKSPSNKPAAAWQDLLYEIEAGVATITLNRPERMNSFSMAMEDELHRAFDVADADPKVAAAGPTI